MIRPANEEDIPRLIDLLSQVNRVHALGRPDLFRLGTKYGPEELKAILRDPAAPVFVHEDDGGVAGYAFCRIKQALHDRLLTDVKELYIDDLCVDEKRRGLGIGRLLYEHVLAYARETGCYHVTLNAWSLNPGAIRFYEKMGMKPMKITMETILE
ncbi:MAG: GNAT family N-acetyltransferase [Clostridia bacterium]|nr:GNAT family N-acetyltransferase [Clostridia bacterium]